MTTTIRRMHVRVSLVLLAIAVLGATPVNAQSQTLLTTQTPAAQNLSDGVSYELGVRVISDVAGQITALRFWKGASESGPHTGHVWTAAGQLLATVAFSNEGASGWQEQALASPVTVAPFAEYVVSVTTSANKLFVVTPGTFGTDLVNGHLRAVAGSNGVYGPVGARPAQSYNSSNYFRDLVFVADTGSSDTTPPTVSITQPAVGTVSGLVTITATSADDVGVAGLQFQVDGANIGSEVVNPPSPSSISWDSRSVANGSRLLTAVVRDAAGHSATASLTVTVANTGTVPSQTLMKTQTPSAQDLTDGTSYELGVRVVSDVAGQITALRFWKGAGETGVHTGHVWTAAGQLLATVTFTNEGASGWQQQALTSPVAMVAHSEYVVSVTTSANNLFVSTPGMFGTELVNGHLRAIGGANGVFGPVGARPTQSSNSANYFRDLVFVPDSDGDTKPPADGHIKIAVIVWTSTSATEVNGSIGDIRTGFFGGLGTGSHADYFGEISYGKWTITGDVYGYYSRHPEIGCFGGSDLQQLAAADGYNASNYTYTVFVNNDCVAAYAESETLFWPAATGHHSRSVLGWTFGIGVSGMSATCIDNTTHAYVTWGTTGVTCTETVFGDLGPDGQGEVLHYPAWQKQAAGLLDPSNVQTVVASGVYAIAPLETPTHDALMLVIQKDGVPLYDLEFRQPVGQDKLYSNPNDDFYRGVIIHQWSDSHPLLDGSPDGIVENAPTLTVDHTFYDADNGVSITPLSVSPTGVQVRIDFGALACVHANPNLTIVPSSAASAPGANLLFKASVKNNDNLGCSPSVFNIAGGLPAGFSQTPASITIAPGATGTAVLNIRSATSSAAGTYPFTLAATNASAPSSTGSASVSVTIQNGSASSAFVRQDDTTQGNWQGTFGSSGYAFPAGATNLPAYVQLGYGTASVSANYGVWWDVQPFSFDLKLTDGQTHQVTLYFTGQDNCGSMTAETVEVFDSSQTVHLDSRVVVPNKSYLVWNMRGNVSIKFSDASNSCPSVSGIFIDAPQ